MTALSITLPGRLAAESARLAERMGISRTEFIRVAVKHEVARIEKEMMLRSMVKSFQAMRKDKHYITESEALDEGFSGEKIEDRDDWWR
ncbi:MAG: ribbon-helix-helix protein, CopG family [Gammaproteobacteria bacterium]|nr:ribbon-helix-helix protein, CopG family [Gammaproteobacteria bacterium]